MEKFVVIIVSSAKCVRCLFLGADNGPDDIKEEFVKGRKFDREFYTEMLKSGRIILRKVTFANNDGSLEEIISITNYRLNGSELSLDKYEKSNDGTNKNGLKINLEFKYIVEKYVPKAIQGYTLFFPSFIVVRKNEWDKLIDSKFIFMKGWALGCCHFKVGDYWMVDRDRKKEDKIRQIDPIPVIEQLLSGEINLDEMPEDPPSQSAETNGNYIKKLVTYTTSRGEIRANDGNLPFSNGLNYSYYPSDFFRLKNAI